MGFCSRPRLQRDPELIYRRSASTRLPFLGPRGSSRETPDSSSTRNRICQRRTSKRAPPLSTRFGPAYGLPSNALQQRPGQQPQPYA